MGYVGRFYTGNIWMDYKDTISPSGTRTDLLVGISGLGGSIKDHYGFFNGIIITEQNPKFPRISQPIKLVDYNAEKKEFKFEKIFGPDN